MKLITLNIWGGHVFEPLMEFVKNHKKDTDIFCFQEVMASNTGKTDDGGCRINVLEDLKKELSDYRVFYRPAQQGFVPVKNERVHYDVHYGLATFITRSIPLLNEGEFFVYRTRNSMKDSIFKTIPRNVHWIQFEVNSKRFTVCNFHGYFEFGPKTDTPERIEQSRKIREFIDGKSEVGGLKIHTCLPAGRLPTSNFSPPKRNDDCIILCGDFNLLPDTESMQALEKDLKNLVKEYKVPTTRSKFYTWDDKFADYILVSNGVKVKKFEVLQDQVSDHLPLLLEF